VTGKKPTVIPTYKRDDRSAVTEYRRINVTTVLCIKLEHVIAGYLRQVWDKNDWLCEGQHGFRQGYSCESRVITVCQDTADSLHKWAGIDAIIIDFFKVSALVPNDELFMNSASSCVDLRVVVSVREFIQ
jgi:hypothetical protein